MPIVGLVGRKGSGKTTTSRIIKSILLDHGHTVHEVTFAAPLKDIAASLFDWDDRHRDGDLKEAHDERYPRAAAIQAQADRDYALLSRFASWLPSEAREHALNGISGFVKYKADNGEYGPDFVTPRYAYQWLGTEGGRMLYNQVWVELAIRSANADPDAWTLLGDVRFPNEALAVKSAGGLLMKTTRSNLAQLDDFHASESYIDSINPDYILDNGQTLDHLRHQLLDILTGDPETDTP